MADPEIQKRVKKVTARVLDIDENSIADDSNFIFDLGASSMQSMLLVAAFEEEFGIEMEEDKALEVQTVSDAANFVEGYL